VLQSKRSALGIFHSIEAIPKDCEQAGARDAFAVKTNITVSSIEFCRCKFDEGDISRGLSGGCGHETIIPPIQSTSHIHLDYRRKDTVDKNFVPSRLEWALLNM
jgi:hypothetical protein